jgi:hypothetical protein
MSFTNRAQYLVRPLMAACALLVATSPAAAANRRVALDIAVRDDAGRAIPVERLSAPDRESVERLRSALGGWVASSPQGKVRLTLECVDGRCKLELTWGRNNQ